MERGFTKKKNYQINEGENRGDLLGAGVGTQAVWAVFMVQKGTSLVGSIRPHLYKYFNPAGNGIRPLEVNPHKMETKMS